MLESTLMVMEAHSERGKGDREESYGSNNFVEAGFMCIILCGINSVMCVCI